MKLLSMGSASVVPSMLAPSSTVDEILCSREKTASNTIATLSAL